MFPTACLNVARAPSAQVPLSAVSAGAVLFTRLAMFAGLELHVPARRANVVPKQSRGSSVF